MSIFASCVLDFWEETEEALVVGTERLGETRRPKRNLRRREVMFESAMMRSGDVDVDVGLKLREKLGKRGRAGLV